MRKLDLADIHRLAQELEHGEPIELWRDGHLVARVDPVRDDVQTRSESLPEWFLTEPLPRFSGSVLGQLLADRHSRDW
ncbi:MAG: hypothetical protein ACTHQM_09025 [Thermoanaerobaculia bacterium]